MHAVSLSYQESIMQVQKIKSVACYILVTSKPDMVWAESVEGPWSASLWELAWKALET